ncbi:MAG: FAD-dependent oxidoreductase [Brevundimonas sp.]|nr:FAD-dependent oxidoreductase [Brevundimonas sp.]
MRIVTSSAARHTRPNAQPPWLSGRRSPHRSRRPCPGCAQWRQVRVGLTAPARSIDWSSDPHSLGGYASRRGPGGWDKAPDLFSPQGRLHFAGTETAGSWRAFMEGAILSGLRAAGEVRNSA